MALPKVPTLIYELTIPGTEKNIKYRPMLVKEYKSLLQAQEFGDEHGFINTIKSIIDDCLFNTIDVNTLPMYSIDYIFLKIRSKSVGENITAQYKCNNLIDSNSCDHIFQVDFNLDNAFVKFPVDYHKKCIIQLSETIGIKLKSPSFEKFRSIGIAGKGTLDITEEYIFACVESVFEDEKVLLPNVDFTIEELREFIESFPAEKIEEISNFFKNQPAVTLIMNLTCPKCGNKSVVELNGLKDFFE